MFHSVAVLSDIHGFLPVLEAVLLEPDVRGADMIVVAGDHASGPQPAEVLELLDSLGERLFMLRGNADRELVGLARGESIDNPDEITVWAAQQLNHQQVELLAGLPEQLVLEIQGFGQVLFCHATPRSDEEVVLVDSRLERWAEVFADLPEEIQTVVCGHTHMPFVRLVNRRLVINPGSIGMPYGRAGGQWAILASGSVTLHRTTVDVDAAVNSTVAGSTFPGVNQWAEYYIRAEASDAKAMKIFGPRDGRGGVGDDGIYH